MPPVILEPSSSNLKTVPDIETHTHTRPTGAILTVQLGLQDYASAHVDFFRVVQRIDPLMGTDRQCGENSDQVSSKSYWLSAEAHQRLMFVLRGEAFNREFDSKSPGEQSWGTPGEDSLYG